MTQFQVRHSTTYTFSAPVELGAHTLYLRPRADHALGVASATLTLSPPAQVIWRNDVYGNSVAIATFTGLSDRLDITSELHVQTFPRSEQQRQALMAIGESVYTPADLRALAPFLPQNTPPSPLLSAWLEKTTSRTSKRTYEKVLECAARIRGEFDYRTRFEEGVQAPEETLTTFSGTCRDFAELLIAASHALGCAARFVTGYIHTPKALPGMAAPHAWAEVYLPGAGWIEIDATNGLVEHADLIPVAVAATGAELSPISGTFTGAAASSLFVGVDVMPR